jgi:hypothetical protein
MRHYEYIRRAQWESAEVAADGGMSELCPGFSRFLSSCLQAWGFREMRMGAFPRYESGRNFHGMITGRKSNEDGRKFWNQANLRRSADLIWSGFFQWIKQVEPTSK